MTPKPEQTDELWNVMKPRCGNADAIEQMNARMMAWHPALEDVRRDDHSVMIEAGKVLNGDVSIAYLFEAAGYDR